MRDRTLVNEIGVLASGRYGRMVIEIVGSLAGSNNVGVFQIRRDEFLHPSEQGQDLLPGLIACEFRATGEPLGCSVEMGNVRSDGTVINALSPVVDSLPLVPGLDFDLMVSRGNVFLDNRVSLDLSDPALYVRYDVGLEDVSTVSRGRLTDMTLPCRDTRVGRGERVEVVQVKVRPGDALVDLFR